MLEMGASHKVVAAHMADYVQSIQPRDPGISDQLPHTYGQKLEL